MRPSIQMEGGTTFHFIDASPARALEAAPRPRRTKRASKVKNDALPWAMPSMFDSHVRTTFQRRVRALRPDAQRRWGRMTAPQMVCHLSDQLRIALGQLPTHPVAGPLRYTPMKQLVIDVLPWPKGRIQGPPEAFTSSPDQWERDVATLLALLDTFGASSGQRMWAPHPNFGRMSGPLWDRLTRRHFDHHLTQFGV